MTDDKSYYYRQIDIVGNTDYNTKIRFNNILKCKVIEIKDSTS